MSVVKGSQLSNISQLGKNVVYQSDDIAEGAFQLCLIQYPESAGSREYTLEIFTDLITLIGEGLVSDTESVSEKIIEKSKSVGENALHQGQSLGIALETIPLFRTAIWDFIEGEFPKLEASVNEVSRTALKIGKMLDLIIYGFSLSYVRNHDSMTKAFHDSLQELSVPVVPLFDGVAILPLIGEIDTNRAQILMNKALEQSKELNLNSLILDLSGVSLIDTLVAHHIFQLADTLELLGIRMIITGISPAIAMTATSLDINLDKLSIRTNLKQALDYLGYGHKESLNKVVTNKF